MSPRGARTEPDVQDASTSVPQAPVSALLGPLPAWAAVAVATALGGEQLALAVRPDPLATTAAAAAALVMLGVAARCASRADAPPRRSAVTAVAAIVLVVAAAVLLRVDTTDRGLLPALASRGGAVDVHARVVQEPRPIQPGWQVMVRVEQVGGIATRERATLVVDGDPPALGDRFVGPATARPLPDGGYGRWLARHHAAVVLDPAGWEPVGAPGRLSSASETTRARVREAATRHLDDPTGGLLVGFVTGDTRLMPPADRDAMQATGLTHLTAVSGSNVAIVVGGVLAAASLLRLGARARRRCIAVAIAWFAFVTRFEPSVLRAGTMAAILLLAGARGVPRDARHALAVAVLVLVLVDPLLAGSLGLLLSATATAGVLVVAPLVRDRLPARLPARMAELASITIGAQVAVVPILLATFGELSLASIPANLVAVPAAAVAATLAFLGTALLAVHVEAGAVLFATAGPAADVVRWSAHVFQDVGGTVQLARPAGVAALLTACLWLLTRRGSRFAGPLVAAAVVLGLVAAAPTVTGRFPVRDLTVTAIDVGQGDAFLVETPTTRLLVDAGADDTAARWLRSNGRTWLDLAVVSHPHLDHVGGMPEVLRRLDVGVLWSNPLPTELPQARELIDVAVDREVAVATPAAGDVVRVGDLTIEVLHPPPGRPYRWARSELNESSYVLRVHHGGRRILFTGEVELSAQTDLLAADPQRLRAEVMTVPHHGAATSEPDFLAAVGADLALIGVGADNRHGHPHALTLAVLASAGVEVVRTDLDGTTSVAVPYPRDHDPRPARRRRRRPAAAARGRAPPRGTACRGPGAVGRHLRRVRARAPPGAAHHLAVRRSYLRGAPRRPDAVRRAQGRGGALPRRSLARCGAGAGRPGRRQGAEDREAGQTARRPRRRQDAGRMGRARLAAAGRRGVPPARAEGRRHRDRGDPGARRQRAGADRLQGRIRVCGSAGRRDADRRRRRRDRRRARPRLVVHDR